MTFSYDWFSNNIENWKVWLDEFKNQPDLRFLEIGCYEGKATRWLLENILTNNSSTILCVDTFEGSAEHSQLDNSKILENFKENVIHVYPERAFFRIGESQKILKTFNDIYDFIYIDGSHVASDVIEDIILAFSLLRSGGIIIMDDYEWDKYDDPHLNPKMAIDAFLDIYKGKYRLISKGYQVCIRKGGDFNGY